jgi:hypothetical protein
VEERAQEVLDSLDDCDTGVEAANELMSTAGTWKKPVRRRVRNVAANSYALKAYLKFGFRPRSEANVIVTRKYISDLLDEQKDMRIRDKIEIMDMAVFLSFVPSRSLQWSKTIGKTQAFSERILGEWADL